MYQPAHFTETRSEILYPLIRDFPLATIITWQNGMLTADHVPLMLTVSGDNILLHGHVAKANLLWKMPTEEEILIIFQGPQAYISPSWYPSKTVAGKVVPTWNYVVVHAYGYLKAIADPAGILNILEQLTQQQEAEQAEPWSLADAPAAYLEQQLRGIVGLEIQVSKLTGKWKVSQNKPREERFGLIQGLRTAKNQAAPTELAMADLIQSYTD